MLQQCYRAFTIHINVFWNCATVSNNFALWNNLLEPCCNTILCAVSCNKVWDSVLVCFNVQDDVWGCWPGLQCGTITQQHNVIQCVPKCCLTGKYGWVGWQLHSHRRLCWSCWWSHDQMSATETQSRDLHQQQKKMKREASCSYNEQVSMTHLHKVTLWLLLLELCGLTTSCGQWWEERRLRWLTFDAGSID